MLRNETMRSNDHSLHRDPIQDLHSDLGTELWLAVEWSLLPNLAIPRISKTFIHSGKYVAEGPKRQMSAMNVLKELFREGLQPAQLHGLHTIRRIHDQHGVPVEDLGYSLSSLLTGIPNWFELFSSQRIGERQQEVLLEFVNQVAMSSGFERLGSSADLNTWCTYQSEFEQTHRGKSLENHQMYLNMMQIFSERFPKPWQWFGNLLFLYSTPNELFQYVDVKPPNPCHHLLLSTTVQLRRRLGPANSISRYFNGIAAGEI